jgi:hypothetical protein
MISQSTKFDDMPCNKNTVQHELFLGNCFQLQQGILYNIDEALQHQWRSKEQEYELK